LVKYGTARQKQRYLCKQCVTQFTEQSIVKSKTQLHTQKRHALILCLVGMSYRGIGELMKRNHMTIYTWLQPYENIITKLKKAKGPEKCDFNELKNQLNKAGASNKLLCIEIETGASFLTI
jgi:hypothetical protein